jgi:hypothetical protein
MPKYSELLRQTELALSWFECFRWMLWCTCLSADTFYLARTSIYRLKTNLEFPFCKLQRGVWASIWGRLSTIESHTACRQPVSSKFLCGRQKFTVLCKPAPCSFRLAYQPPASSTFLSEQTRQQYFSLGTNQHQPPAKRAGCGTAKHYYFLFARVCQRCC